jgi:hypothetical protein
MAPNTRLWHLAGMRSLRLAPLFFSLAACTTTPRETQLALVEPTEPAALAATAPADAPAASEPVTAPVVADPQAWAKLEMRGAPYERAYTETLAVVPPRELSGAAADERARRAFHALSEKEQRDLLDWFTVECEKANTFQGTLIRFILDSEERARDSWPALAAPTWYDPSVHATGQPIPRSPLAPDAPEVLAVRNQILGAPGTRALDSGWMVDYGERTLVRLPGQNDPVRVFENGLLGMAPDWDLVEALVELRLDDGSLQKSFQAFGHAYTDRWGGVYPGITLYDAHAALTTIEMPDVDALGILHDLVGDWQTYQSPVPAEQHAELYAKIEDLFRPLVRHRGLRTNLARTYLCGSAELRDSYRHNLDNFHALWDSVASDPASLRPQLPDDARWREYLQGWDDQLRATPALYLSGTSRHAALERDRQTVRTTLVRLLDEYGATARVETLPPYDQ